MSTNMGNLEKLGILVIVILVVVVGVVAITPKSTVDAQLAPALPTETATQPEPLDAPGANTGSTGAAQGPTDPWPGQAGGGTRPLPSGTSLDPASSPDAKFRVAKVQDKDTLAIIAQRELGSATLYQEILDANPGLNPAKLEKGKEIRIPLVVAPSQPLDGGASGAAGQGATRPDATQPTSTATNATGKVYVVKRGDTLSEIARHELGSTAKWPEIAKANEDVLHGSTALKPGMKLQIPAGGGSNESVRSEGAAAAAAPSSSGEREYVVQSGDSLWLIAKKEMGSETCLKELRTANKDVLKGSDSLKVGMKLKIPAKR